MKAAHLALIALTAIGALVLAGWVALDRIDAHNDSEAARVEGTVRGLERAIARDDLEAFRTLTTPEYFQHFMESAGPAGQAAGEGSEFSLGLNVERRIQSIKVNGDEARVLATIRGQQAKDLDAVEVQLVRREGAWLVDKTGPTKAPIPANSQVIELTMGDSFFHANEFSLTRQGPVVIRAHNVGPQRHMVGIWRVPEGAELIKVIEATNALPQGVERLVHSQVFDPGDEGDIVLEGGFGPGRYMMTCFLSDTSTAELVPFHDKGMLTEFQVK